ncbi:hypothetical protein J4E93_008810 [Alternaria ventricosa]|uniref:uncharacterized protein n=1 Tax=Alternaria ventricosa TaxID=1187951 RepID=UPI0020C4ABBA|nr:uncharacterized protein J4E93_008810 [Alternaria ventricosa]KAI4640011.1 hypothetical protein J4E93_008810 [Alternaria ventricosa]
MIPSLEWYEMKDAFPANGSTVLYNATAAEIWPTVLNNSMDTYETARCLQDPFRSPLNLHCPSAGFMDIYKWFIGFTKTGSRDDLLFTDLYASSVQRKVSIKTGNDPKGAWAYTTVITELSTRTLGTFYNYARHNNAGGTRDMAYPRLRITADTPIHQPIVYVKCSLSLWTQVPDRLRVPFPNIDRSQAWGQEALHPEAETKYAKSNDTVFDRLPSKNARFKWYKNSNGDLSSSLFALAIIPVSAKNPTKDRYSSTAAVACPTDARWVSSDAYYQPKNSTTVSSNVSDALSETEWKPEKALLTKLGISENPLDLRLDWAHFLNRQQSEWLADNSSSSVSGMARFLNTAIIRPKSEKNNITKFFAPNITSEDTGGAIEEAIAMLVGTVLVDGIARSTFRLSSLVKSNATNGDVVTKLETFLPSGERLYKWKSYVPGFYSVRITLDSYGYGYGLQNTAVWAAMVILLLFALMLIVHVAFIGYSIARGRYYGGECWEDVAELIALAMNSAPSDKLYGTSAGVERPETWTSMIQIQETGDQHLELCVVDGQQEDGETVKIGKKYL